ncbi:hypothetical protein Ddye_019327 [Dipteronia dyeriana]|uniref:ABC transporter domain-containing protein n=1 Tax=Dipteronia dyeriana TaxID=168575 RepID=A0AAD9WVM3_9ROSI|nr:hypothetical protein Ddye_019327 [Dipteronia dyeriana]
METDEMENMEVEAKNQTEHKFKDIFKKAKLLVTLKFEDVKHQIRINTRGGFCFKQEKKPEEKLILKGVSGAVSPGELLAILGPSGSGKTTLLKALGGRVIDRNNTTGKITYNGKPFSATMNRKTGFVAQTSVFYPHLTVTETLVFTALLLLPDSLTKREKILYAEAVMDQLGLTRCKDTIVGGNFIRGISGGEKKRLSIGQELLINPSLLFLDEPTSGLDSTIAKQIVLSLWRLAKGGRTILMTIHQPSSSLFYMFNKLLLLSEGSSLYFGNREDVMNYFSSIGFVPPSVAMNPSDFILDLANGVLPGDSKQDGKAVIQTLVSAYREQSLSDKLKSELQNMENHYDHIVTGNNKWRTTWWQQFSVLLKRGLKARRHESFSRLKILQVLAVSFITGLIWWQSSTANIQDQVGLLFFYNRFGGFLPLFQAIFTFPHERLMLEKERSSGMYRLSSYFMARTTADLPMELALPTVFVVITYWMGGLKPTSVNFFHTLSIVLYTALVAQSLGLAIGAVVMKQRIATAIGSDIMLTFLLTGGFLVQDVPGFISWIKYLSLTHYSYKLLLISQYKPDEIYVCDSNNNVTCLVEEYLRIKFVGLHQQFLCVFALALMLIGFRLVAYIALMRVGVTHQIHRQTTR